jgi:hypothetical protein
VSRRCITGRVLVRRYPTLARAAGIAKLDAGLEGLDASPLLDAPQRAWKLGAISQYARCPNPKAYNGSTGWYTRCSGDTPDQFLVMGYALRVDTWRYVEWFSWNRTTAATDFASTVSRELYAHSGGEYVPTDWDASENTNVVDDPANKATVARLAKLLRAGWKALLPAGAPGRVELNVEVPVEMA